MDTLPTKHSLLQYLKRFIFSDQRNVLSFYLRSGELQENKKIYYMADSNTIVMVKNSGHDMYDMICDLLVRASFVVPL
jgi:hypothetical protein